MVMKCLEAKGWRYLCKISNSQKWQTALSYLLILENLEPPGKTEKKTVIVSKFKQWFGWVSSMSKHHYYYASMYEVGNVWGSEMSVGFFWWRKCASTASGAWVFFLIYFFIEGWFLYRILLFSVKCQHESAIGIYISPPFWTSLPSASPSHPSRLIQSPCLSFLSHTANSRWLSI